MKSEFPNLSLRTVKIMVKTGFVNNRKNSENKTI